MAQVKASIMAMVFVLVACGKQGNENKASNDADKPSNSQANNENTDKTPIATEKPLEEPEPKKGPSVWEYQNFLCETGENPTSVGGDGPMTFGDLTVDKQKVTLVVKMILNNDPNSKCIYSVPGNLEGDIVTFDNKNVTYKMTGDVEDCTLKTPEKPHRLIIKGKNLELKSRSSNSSCKTEIISFTQAEVPY